jgi:hypothetical protein
VLYRIAEMMEARAGEFADLCSGKQEVERAIDRWVWYAGFADKLAQAIGSANAVAGPYFNFTVPRNRRASSACSRPRSRRSSGSSSRLVPPLVGGQRGRRGRLGVAPARRDRAG